MITHILLLISLLITMSPPTEQYEFDLQGHRGARGLAPENSIPAFLKALEYPVNTLELDVVITKDKKVIVSHDPYISANICLDKNGTQVEDEKAHNIYQLNLADVQAYDCGSKPHPGFPEQTLHTVQKPLLSDVFAAVEQHITAHHLNPIQYNIELKSTEEGDNIYHPEIQEFASLVKAVMEESDIAKERFIVQSFDFRMLKHWHQDYADIKLAMLIETTDPWERQIENLGFQPEIYSPYYSFLDEDVIRELQKLGMQVIPWTVNDTSTMKMLLDWGVDGLITDYPNRASAFK